MNVFYDERMAVDSGGYSPSAFKPKQVVEDWLDHGLEIQIAEFPAATGDIMSVAHDPKYVADILHRRINNGHGNKRRSVANSLRWTVGSHYAASLAAIEYGVACSPTSGFHHAHYASNHGYCTINGLMVSAGLLLSENRVGNIAIIDYDIHYGDGTQDIIDALGLGGSVAQWGEFGWDASMSYAQNIVSDLDEILALEPDLVMYQAGADMHIDDPLGGILDTTEMRFRDRMVFEWCKAHRTPVVWNLAGGYQREADGSVPMVLEIHRNTMKEAIRSFAPSLA